MIPLPARTLKPTRTPIARTASAPNEQAGWIAAIGEPTRLALIRALAVGAQTVTNLAREVGTEMVNVSHHSRS